MATYTKIPRKLKKRLKKLKLDAHSEYYKKFKKMKPKRIRVTYYDSTRRVFGTDLIDLP